MKRPVTTLFLLTSVDGKISTGATDALDVDRDFPKIEGVREGVAQYYEIEQTTDLWSLNTGRVQAKMGVNEKPLPKEKSPVSFVIIDSKHLTEGGVRYFAALSQTLVIVTTTKEPPAFNIKAENLYVLLQDKLSLSDALSYLYTEHGCESITLQSGGSLNGLFLREKLIDKVDIVMAPVLVGGKDTVTMIDGEAILCPDQLGELGVLKLTACTPLKDSYIRLQYDVIG